MLKPEGLIDKAPRFVVTGVRLFWNDGVPAYLRQTPFQAIDDVWEAALHIAPAPTLLAEAPIAGRLRLTLEVFEGWKERSCEPVFETCRQIQDAMRRYGVVRSLGIVELTDTYDWLADQWLKDALAYGPLVQMSAQSFR